MAVTVPLEVYRDNGGCFGHRAGQGSIHRRAKLFLGKVVRALSGEEARG